MASLLATSCFFGLFAANSTAADKLHPVRIIYDTDMGGDCDDVLALGMLHILQDKKECELLAVTASNENPLVAPFIDAVNSFYGHPDIPIGVARNAPSKRNTEFLALSTKKEKDGTLRYPHDLLNEKDAPDAVQLLRSTLANQPDNSVVLIQVGMSTNLSRLLTSKPDKTSPLTGKELVTKKVRLLSVMGGAFEPIKGNSNYPEYNIRIDIPAAKHLFQEWPTEIVCSGFEIGIALRYPAKSIDNDYEYVKHHPLPEAYNLYKPTPHERPTWDLTSVLYAVRPNHDYFSLSNPGMITVADKAHVLFAPANNGKHRYLVLSKKQRPNTHKALVELCIEPPAHLKNKSAE